MSQQSNSSRGRSYWRSLDQLADQDDFRRWLHREFPENAEELSAPSRRSMLKLMAASFGLAGLTACRRPVEHIMPFSRGVEDIVPGKAVYYATSTTRGPTGDRSSVDRALVTQAADTLEPPEPDRLEVAFYADSCVWDGHFANNGWLQEAPDPMTKLTWDNAALVSPATAELLVLETGDVIAIELAGAEAEMPVWVQPGHADHVISLALGYGRTRVGRVGDGVGHNAYPIRTSAGMGFRSGATVSKTGWRHVFASTQEHHSMEGRPLVR